MESVCDNGNRSGVPRPLLIAILMLMTGCAAEPPPQFHHPAARRSLLVRDEQIAQVRELARTDVQLAQVAANLQKSADRLLNDPPLERKLIGPRLLAVSRDAQRRIWLLAGIYRWTGDRKYVDRAIVELRAVCSFTDWNPSHFLDVAEMCAAVSVGYDWLYDELSDVDRELFRRAIVTKALLPGIEAFHQKLWWTTTDNNWAQVCSGGLLLGALAVRGEEPDIALKTYELVTRCMKCPMQVYSPDGGYKEGAAYWSYGTRYSIFYFAALQSVLNQDSPLIQSEGFDRTGFFRIHTIGASGQLFNYADCNEAVDSASHMFWLAKQFHQPIFAQHEREYARVKPDILHLLWWDAGVADLSNVPTHETFSTAGAICARSGWDKPAMYIGMKAGRSNFSHAHLDLGSFVLDWNGERWAADLGSDNYDLPGYFGPGRWLYYRLRTEGHNTIQVDGEEQTPGSEARIAPDGSISFVSGGVRVTRSALIQSAEKATLTDRIEAAGPHRIVWTLHTRAAVSLSEDRRTALLRMNGKGMEIRLASAEGRFISTPLDLPRPQKSTQGITKVQLFLDTAESTEIRVDFVGGK